MDGVCTDVTLIPAVSCDRDFVDSLASVMTEGQLNPMHLFDVVLDALS